MAGLRVGTVDAFGRASYLDASPIASMLRGTVGDVLDQAAVWRDHGVRHIVVVNFGPMQPSLRGAVGTMRPFNKVIRGLKRL